VLIREEGDDLNTRGHRPRIWHEQRRRSAARTYIARTPPSTWISEPVMYDDSSEAKNRMVYATSSTSPGRRMGPKTVLLYVIIGFVSWTGRDGDR